MKITARHRKEIRRIIYSVIYRPGRERISKRARYEAIMTDLWEGWEKESSSTDH